MARNKTVRLSSATFSDWIRINAHLGQGSFAVGLAGVMSSNGNLTWSVQHTLDPIYVGVKDWSASRTTTTATVTRTNHGLSVGSWVYFPDGPAPFNAAYSVATITDQNTFTFTVANSGASTVGNGAYPMHTARVIDHDDLVGETTTQDGNYAFPPVACRLIVTSYTAGYIDLTVSQAGG